MKLLHLLVCILLLPFALFSQTNVSEVLRQLAASKSDTQKINLYKQLIRHYSVSKPDSSAWYGEQGIKFAQQNNDPLGEARVVAQLGTIDVNQGRMEVAEKRMLYALNIFRQHNDAKGMGEMNSNLGAIEGSKGNFEEATRYLVAALKTQDSLKDYYGLMITCSNLGSMYLEHEDTANAAKYLKMGEHASRLTPLVDQSISLYNAIGILKIAEGDTIGGLNTFLHDLELSNQPAFMSAHSECLLYLCNFYEDKGQIDQALNYLHEGLDIATKQHLPEMQANCLREMATLTAAKDPVEAMRYLQQAKAICDSTGNRTFLVNVLGSMTDIYQLQGNYKEAFATLQAQQKLIQQLFSLDKTKEITSISEAYQFETNQRIRQLEVLSKHNEYQRNVIIVIAVIIILFLLVLMYFYRKTRALNRQLLINEKELKELNSTKDKLFSVIGHDLRGPIARIPTIIDIYEDEITTEEEKKYLLDNLKEHTKASLETFDKLLYWGQLLVNGIRLHQTKIKPKGYIRENIDLKKIKAAEKNIQVTDHTPEDIMVFVDYAHFDFIIRNLLANALKYTNKNGHVTITADTVSNPGFTIFAVTDDGIGMSKETQHKLFSLVNSNEGTASEKGNGIGLMLCKEFAIKNGGDIWLQSEEGKGTTFYFSVKNAT
jgi:signal transduction histidine kinase